MEGRMNLQNHGSLSSGTGWVLVWFCEVPTSARRSGLGSVVGVVLGVGVMSAGGVWGMSALPRCLSMTWGCSFLCVMCIDIHDDGIEVGDCS